MFFFFGFCLEIKVRDGKQINSIAYMEQLSYDARSFTNYHLIAPIHSIENKFFYVFDFFGVVVVVNKWLVTLHRNQCSIQRSQHSVRCSFRIFHFASIEKQKNRQTGRESTYGIVQWLWIGTTLNSCNRIWRIRFNSLCIRAWFGIDLHILRLFR